MNDRKRIILLSNLKSASWRNKIELKKLYKSYPDMEEFRWGLIIELESKGFLKAYGDLRPKDKDGNFLEPNQNLKIETTKKGEKALKSALLLSERGQQQFNKRVVWLGVILSIITLFQIIWSFFGHK